MPLHHLFHVAARHDGNLALAVAMDKPIGTAGMAHVLDLKSNKHLRPFPVRYDQAGQVALSGQNQLAMLGCYEAYGLAAYDMSSGAEVWRRKDLKAFGSVTASEVKPLVFCGRERGGTQVLEAETGKTIEKLKGVEAVYPSPFDESLAVIGRSLDLHSPFGHKVATLEEASEYVSSCSFSQTEVVLNVSNDCLRCYDLKNYQRLWTHEIAGSGFVPRLCYCGAKRSFVMLGGKNLLLVLDARSGKVSRRVELAEEPGWYYAFCHNGSDILTSNLQLVSTDTGEILSDLATPELLAWDPVAQMERFRQLAGSPRSKQELARYMASEGFAKNDIQRVLLLKHGLNRESTS